MNKSNSENILSALANVWLLNKRIEQEAVENRRKAEDQMLSLIGIAENLEGTETAKPDGYVIKVTGRIDRKVDADKLQALATDAGLFDQLQTLFRWRPEINLAVWKATDKKITGPLAAAITAKPGRPSFSITTTTE